MLHLDDFERLREWQLYGPENEAVFELVTALASKGLRVSEIETLIEVTLRLRLAELEAFEALPQQ